MLFRSETAVLVGNRSGGQKESVFDPLAGCAILEDNCRDVDCAFYNLCDGVQKQCQVYDCGKEYRIVKTDAEGRTETKNEPKSDADAIVAEQDSCRGEMHILEQGCVDDHFQARVRLQTQGECEIGYFVLTLKEFGNVQSESESLGDGSYLITTDRCGQATRIGPVTKDGMYLEF